MQATRTNANQQLSSPPLGISCRLEAEPDRETGDTRKANERLGRLTVPKVLLTHDGSSA
jgi:hypothetical protein